MHEKEAVLLTSQFWSKVEAAIGDGLLVGRGLGWHGDQWTNRRSAEEANSKWSL